MLRVNNLSISYDQHRALEKVAIEVAAGEIVVVLGANGAGKSTLLKSIGGMIPATKGAEISVDGILLQHASMHVIVEAGIALVPEGRGVFKDLTVKENLKLGAYARRALDREAENYELVVSLFPLLAERSYQIVRTMSGGEQQMVAIGRAMMSQPRILMLDEPSLGLSPLLTKAVFNVLTRIKKTGIGVLLVEQNARQSLAIADRCYILENGCILRSGPAGELSEDQSVQAAYLGVDVNHTKRGEIKMRETGIYKMFINGQYIDSSNKELHNDMNPTLGQVYAQVSQATVADVTRAIDSAEEAFKSWKSVVPAKRERILLKAADLMEERAAELRDVLMDEGGSTFLKASFEVHETPDFLRSMAGEARRITGSTYQSSIEGVMSYSIRRPLGIVAAISPFNFPLLLSTRKIGWALAAGNCVILKPSNYTPVISLKLGELLFDAGLPAGVLNVVTGGGSEIGNHLIDDPRVRYVTFTGSSEVGKKVGVRCAAGHKKYALEMGGKNPVIILDDADVDYAVDAAAFSNFLHQGQICMTGSRVIVEAGIYDEFCEKFTAKVSKLKAGSPREHDTIVGPLIDPGQSAYIKEMLDEAVASGARIMTGGTYQGALFQPTVLADVTPAMSIFKNECFGPAASVCKARDYLHAIELANDNDYGLSSAVITNDLQKAIAVSENIEAGMVHINGPSVRDEGTIPFGGIKNSGLGREGGCFSIEEMTELKWVTIQKGQQRFPF